MAIQEYIAQDWLDILRFNQLDGFDRLWQLDPGQWFEPLNHRGKGWSGVFRRTLQLPGGGETGVFIKRQENFFYRSWRNFFLPAAIFEREFRNLLWFRRLGIPTLEPVYFGQRRQHGNRQAILVTRELTGFLPLDASCYNPVARKSREWRKSLCTNLAGVIRNMHAHRVQFNCLYPKHIFIQDTPGSAPQIRLIDLEKAKWQPFRRIAMVRDLASLHRRTAGWSRTDRLRFFLDYRQEKHLSPQSKKLLAAILQRTRLKTRA